LSARVGEAGCGIEQDTIRSAKDYERPCDRIALLIVDLNDDRLWQLSSDGGGLLAAARFHNRSAVGSGFRL
jgi:hypothetical protein